MMWVSQSHFDPYRTQLVAPAAAEESFLAEGRWIFMLLQPQQRILASEAIGKAILDVI
jgi:hypothetical protein